MVLCWKREATTTEREVLKPLAWYVRCCLHQGVVIWSKYHPPTIKESRNLRSHMPDMLFYNDDDDEEEKNCKEVLGKRRVNLLFLCLSCF